MEAKEYFRFEDIADEKSVLVLDTTAFNGLKGNKGLLKRLLPERLKSPQDRAEIIKDIKNEADYLDNLSTEIQKRSNIIVSDGVASELKSYQRKIKKAINKLQSSGIRIWEPYLFSNGIEEIISVSQEFGVPRSRTLIQRDRVKFEEYSKWVADFLEREKKFLDKTLPTEDLSEELREYSYEDCQLLRDRRNDVAVLSLSLTAALQQPTILFTGDIRHIVHTARTMYGYNSRRYFSSPAPPELPSKSYKVFAGLEEGWRLLLDSALSPVASGECSWSKLVSEK